MLLLALVAACDKTTALNAIIQWIGRVMEVTCSWRWSHRRGSIWWTQNTKW